MCNPGRGASVASAVTAQITAGNWRYTWTKRQRLPEPSTSRSGMTTETRRNREPTVCAQGSQAGAQPTWQRGWKPRYWWHCSQWWYVLYAAYLDSLIRAVCRRVCSSSGFRDTPPSAGNTGQGHRAAAGTAVAPSAARSECSGPRLRAGIWGDRVCLGPG